MKHHLKWLAPILLILGLWGYHYLAASQAEQDIDEALQELADNVDDEVKINYTSIQVHPFDGDVFFGETNILYGDNIYGFTSLKLDLTYWKFLTIYVRGAEYVFKNINEFTGELAEPSLLIQSSLSEYKSDQVTLSYRGSLYDLLSHFINEVPYEQHHQLAGDAQNFRYAKEDSPWGTFETESLSFSIDLAAGTESLLAGDRLEFNAFGLNWNPPDTFQEKYGFFIRGFGYEAGTIPTDSLRFQAENPQQDSSSSLNMNIYNELFQAQATADLVLSNRSLAQSKFEDGNILLVNTSEEFQNFLDNAQQFFGVKLPATSETLFTFRGPIFNPDIRLDN